MDSSDIPISSARSRSNLSLYCGEEPWKVVVMDAIFGFPAAASCSVFTASSSASVPRLDMSRICISRPDDMPRPWMAGGFTENDTASWYFDVMALTRSIIELMFPSFPLRSLQGLS